MTYFTTSDGTRLHYRVEGSGSPTLIFVHGWCSSLRHWDAQAAYFSPKHRVLRYDRRGHGRSGAPSHGYTPAQHAVDLAELARSLRVRNAVIVGVAGGAPTVLEFAGQHPELARAVVLIEAGFRTVESSGGAAVDRAAPFRDANGRAAFEDAYRAFFHEATDRRIREGAVREAAKTELRIAIAELEGLDAADTQVAAKAVSQPVLWIVATSRPGISDSDTVSRTFRASTYGQVVGSGHHPQLETPAQVNGMIERFLIISRRRH